MRRLIHTLATLAAAVWFGGMILVAIAAMNTFRVLRAQEIQNPDAIAGRVMAPTFAMFDKVQLGCAAVLLIGAGATAIFARRKIRPLATLIAVAVATGCLIYSAQFLTPKILALQDDVASTVSESEVRQVFDDFHESAVTISKINLFLVGFALITLAWSGPISKTIIDEPNDTGSPSLETTGPRH